MSGACRDGRPPEHGQNANSSQPAVKAPATEKQRLRTRWKFSKILIASEQNSNNLQARQHVRIFKKYIICLELIGGLTKYCSGEASTRRHPLGGSLFPTLHSHLVSVKVTTPILPTPFYLPPTTKITTKIKAHTPEWLYKYLKVGVRKLKIHKNSSLEIKGKSHRQTKTSSYNQGK